jgi:transposase
MGHYEDHSWVCTKRLEKGRFHWPSANETGKVTMRPEEFSMLINGLDLEQAAPRRAGTGCGGARLHKTFLLGNVRL